MLTAIAAMMLAAGPPARPAPPAPAAAELTKLLQEFLAGASRNDAATHDRFWAEDVANHLNTGTFLKRGGRGKAVAWQATRLPRPEDEARREVASVHDAFHQAMLAADVEALAFVLDDGFVWTHRAGERVARPQLLDQIGAGRLKYSKLETSDVAVAISGETAIVRGVSTRQRSAIPEPAGSSDAAPFTAFYTMTLVQKGGGWKAVALHTSRP